MTWSTYEGRACLHAHGWSEDERRFLATLTAAELAERLAVLPSELVAAGAELRALQPLAGRFALAGDALCFLPLFPFSDGTGYALLVGPLSEVDRADTREVWTILRPARASEPATDVVALYPSGAELPVNQLKLYVHFSGPMSEGWAARAVRVQRARDGAPLSDVFLASTTELWDRGRQRLTLLLDPGRIKRGLVPNAEAGYPLVEGEPIVVSIDAVFRDAAGRPLRAGLARRYEVGPPLRTRVDPAAWRCDVPHAGSTDALVVTFDRPLDRALLEHSLWVHDAAGAPLAGSGAVGAEEGSWRFTPQTPWQPGNYLALVDPRLEDLAGNSLSRVFDRDLALEADAPAAPGPVALAFTCADGAEPGESPQALTRDGR